MRNIATTRILHAPESTGAFSSRSSWVWPLPRLDGAARIRRKTPTGGRIVRSSGADTERREGQIQRLAAGLYDPAVPAPSGAEGAALPQVAPASNAMKCFMRWASNRDHTDQCERARRDAAVR